MRGNGRKAAPLSLETAEGIAAQGLAFLAAESGGLQAFMALTGLTPGELRARAESRELLAAVLEHLSADESLLLVFATGAHVAPETIAPAIALLREAGSQGQGP
jgi:hypothetical protein